MRRHFFFAAEVWFFIYFQSRKHQSFPQQTSEDVVTACVPQRRLCLCLAFRVIWLCISGREKMRDIRPRKDPGFPPLCVWLIEWQTAARAHVRRWWPHSSSNRSVDVTQMRGCNDGVVPGYSQSTPDPQHVKHSVKHREFTAYACVLGKKEDIKKIFTFAVSYRNNCDRLLCNPWRTGTWTAVPRPARTAPLCHSHGFRCNRGLGFLALGLQLRKWRNRKKKSH